MSLALTPIYTEHAALILQLTTARNRPCCDVDMLAPFAGITIRACMFTSHAGLACPQHASGMHIQRRLGLSPCSSLCRRTGRFSLFDIRLAEALTSAT